MRPFDLTRRSALVTGCGSAEGIGFASAAILTRLGARIAITSTTERIHEREAELRASGAARRVRKSVCWLILPMSGDRPVGWPMVLRLESDVYSVRAQARGCLMVSRARADTRDRLRVQVRLSQR